MLNNVESKEANKVLNVVGSKGEMPFGASVSFFFSSKGLKTPAWFALVILVIKVLYFVEDDIVRNHICIKLMSYNVFMSYLHKHHF